MRNAYHTIPAAGTVGARDPKQVWLDYKLPEHLDNLTLLDIGAWDGGFSLEACERGARHVVALDNFANKGWQHPPIQSIHNVRRCTGAWFDIVVHDIQQPFPGHFDVVLFLQVMYHLINPFAGLINAANCVRPGGKLFVESLVTKCNDGAALYWLGHESTTDYWVPTKQCVEGLLTALGFSFFETWSVPCRVCWQATLNKTEDCRYLTNSLNPAATPVNWHEHYQI